MPPVCSCGRPFEPTHALSLFYPIRPHADEFPWTCRYCRIVSSNPSEPVDTDEPWHLYNDDSALEEEY